MCRSVVTFHCFINPEVTDILGSSDFIGWLYRFPPVSRRRGFMTSQSDTQWVTVCLPACRRPTQLALPLSDKPLRRLWRFDATLVLEEHLKIFFDQYFHTAALCVGDFFFFSWEVCWEPVLSCSVLCCAARLCVLKLWRLLPLPRPLWCLLLWSNEILRVYGVSGRGQACPTVVCQCWIQ